MVRKSIFLLILLFLISAIDVQAKGTRSYRLPSSRSYKLKVGKQKPLSVKIPKAKTTKSSKPKKSSSEKVFGKMPVYNYHIGKTHYQFGQYYKSTAYPKVVRDYGAKMEFLRSRGLKGVPAGYEVDHIIPLFKGGADAPYNMQLIPKTLHKLKTANDRK